MSRRIRSNQRQHRESPLWYECGEEDEFDKLIRKTINERFEYNTSIQDSIRFAFKNAIKEYKNEKIKEENTKEENIKEENKNYLVEGNKRKVFILNEDDNLKEND